MGWAEKEFESLDLGDARLNRRAVLLAERLSQKPGASIPGACESWSETTAAYRFLGNEEVSWDDVMGAHWDASQQRISQHETMLCLQDTTGLDFNGQLINGLGPLSYEAQRGLLLHLDLCRDTPTIAIGGHQRLDVGQKSSSRGMHPGAGC